MSWPTWKFLPPRWNKTYRKTQDNLNVLLDFGKKHVENAKTRIAEKGVNDDTNEMSVLQKLIIRNGPESTYPLVMAIDMIFAGMDTTGNTLGFLMYHLASNPEKQEILRQECQSLGPNLEVKDLNELRYLKACIQETLRMTPVIPLMLRIIPNDLILHGYHIPKNTLIVWNYVLFSDQFTESDKFIPERWIENKKSICPHAVRPFSHGPRMCIGKRFAELEILVVMHKMMTNFELKWVNPEPMTISQVGTCNPDQSLDFQFNSIL